MTKKPLIAGASGVADVAASVLMGGCLTDGSKFTLDGRSVELVHRQRQQQLDAFVKHQSSGFENARRRTSAIR